MNVDFEYAIKKDVRNNPIVRGRQRATAAAVEVARHRRVARAGRPVLGAAELRALQHGYQLQRLQEQKAAEQEVNRHLRLELETLRSRSGSRDSEEAEPGHAAA